VKTVRAQTLTFTILLALSCGAPLDPHAPHPLGKFMCDDGDLPCWEQVHTLRCDSVTPGVLAPDVDDLRWMLRGAKMPQAQVPPVNLIAWCSGSIDVEGIKMDVELFRNIEGGYLRPPGSDRIWFQTPPEEAESAEKRMCVGLPMPTADQIAIGACESVTKQPAPDLAGLQRLIGSSRRVEHRAWGLTEPAGWASCETRIGSERRRIDLFEGQKGFIRLPDQRRICFVW
jgi:hypothetical protein